MNSSNGLNVTASAKRKSSNAKVLLVSGSGNIRINNQEVLAYFAAISSDTEKLLIPIRLLSVGNCYDFFIKVKGGGYMSQLNATQLAISKALAKINKQNRILLSDQKLLYSDSRIKERRKYGLRKARKAAQYHKR